MLNPHCLLCLVFSVVFFEWIVYFILSQYWYLLCFLYFHGFDLFAVWPHAFWQNWNVMTYNNQDNWKQFFVPWCSDLWSEQAHKKLSRLWQISSVICSQTIWWQKQTTISHSFPGCLGWRRGEPRRWDKYQPPDFQPHPTLLVLLPFLQAWLPLATQPSHALPPTTDSPQRWPWEVECNDKVVP